MPTVAEIFQSLFEGPSPVALGGNSGGMQPPLEFPTLTAEELDVLQPGGSALIGRPNHSALLSSVGPAAGRAVEAAVARSLMARGLITIQPPFTAPGTKSGAEEMSAPHGAPSRSKTRNVIEAAVCRELQVLLEVRRSPLSLAVLDTNVSAGRVGQTWSSVFYGMVTEVDGQSVRALMEERISPDLFHSFTVRGFPEAVESVITSVDSVIASADDGSETGSSDSAVFQAPPVGEPWPEVDRALSTALRVSRIESTFPGNDGPCLVRTGIAVGKGSRLLIVGTRRGSTTSLSARFATSKEIHAHVWGILAGDESVVVALEKSGDT